MKEIAAKRVPMGSTVPVRDRGAVQERIGRAEGMLRAVRAYLYDAMADVWERTQARENLTTEQRAGLLLACTHTMQTSAEVVDLMFTAGGSSAVFTTHALERLFRDANVLRQHGFGCVQRYETCGQVLLGLEPDSRRPSTPHPKACRS